MKYISVCSGIEAASQAWHPLGWTPLAFSEIEPFPSAVLAHHYPNVPNLGDMTQFKNWNYANQESNEGTKTVLEPIVPLRDDGTGLPSDDHAAEHAVRPLRVSTGSTGDRPRPRLGASEGDHLPPVQHQASSGGGRGMDDASPSLHRGQRIDFASVDILVGGTPCQAFSVAGLRKSMQDARGCLSMTYIQILDLIDEERNLAGRPPSLCVWENVPGVLSTSDNAFGCFLGGLAGSGGALEPPDTERGWADAGFVRGPGRDVAWRTLDAQYFGLAQRRKRVFVVASARGGICPAKVLLIEQGVSRHLAPSRKTRQGSALDVAGCLGSGSSPTGGGRRPGDCLDSGALIPELARSLNAHASRVDGESETFIPVHANGGGQVAIAFERRMVRTSGGQPQEELHPCLRADTNTGDGAPCVAFAQNTRDEIREMEVVGALAAEPGMKQTSYLRQGYKVRRITPLEAERLQGFSDNYTNIPWRGKDHSPDGPRYKALGNSMAVPVMRWIGERIAVIDAVQSSLK